MVLVRGNDTYSGVEIAPESTWGTKATVSWERVHPLLEESFTVEMTPLPQPKHFGLGGQPVENYDVGRQLVKGSFTVYPSYNGRFLHYLLGQGHGGSELTIAGTTPASTSVTNCGTHMYLPVSYRTTLAGSVSAVGNGFTVRAWKSGPSAGSGTYCDVFTGCVVSKMTINQPDEDRPTWTFEFMGYALTTGTIGDNTATSPMTYASENPRTVVASTGWTNPTNVVNDDGLYATATTNGVQLDLSNLPNLAAKLNAASASSSVVSSVQVQVDAKKADSGTASTTNLKIYLSIDGGSNWSAAQTTSNLTTSEVRYTANPGTTWGLTTSISSWVSANVRVRIETNITPGSGTTTVSVDYVLVTVRAFDMELRAPQSNMVTIGMRDYKGRPSDSNLPGLVSIGQTTQGAHGLAAINTRGFTVTIDPHLETPPPFLTAFDTVDKPAHTDLWECTGTIRSLLEQDYGAAGKPHYMFANKQDGCIRIRYVSASTDIPSSSPAVGYAMDLFFPTVVWTSVKDSFDDVIPTVEWNFSTYAPQTTGYGVLAGETALGAGAFPCQWVIQVANANTTPIGFSVIESGQEGGDRQDIDTDPATPIVLQAGALEVAPTANDADADWTTPNNAHADGGGNATTVVLDSALTFTTFDVSTIPAGAEITSIAVKLDGKYDDTNGSGTLDFGVKLSWDAGTSWTTESRTSTITTTEDTYWVSGGGSLFGRAWTRAELDDLRVRVYARGSAVVDDPEWRLDFVRVRISYIGQVI